MEVVYLFSIVPINDGVCCVCKDDNGRPITKNKSHCVDQERLLFVDKFTAQKYINKYLDRNAYVPEIIMYNIKYVPENVIYDV